MECKFSSGTNSGSRDFCSCIDGLCVCRFVVGSKVTPCKHLYDCNPSKIH